LLSTSSLTDGKSKGWLNNEKSLRKDCFLLSESRIEQFSRNRRNPTKERRVMKVSLPRKATVTATIAIILVGGFIAYYYLTLPTQNSKDEIPYQTRLNNGDYVKYIERSFVNGTKTLEYPLSWETSEGTINESDCFILKVTANVDANTTTLIFWYMNKTTNDCISMKTQTFVNGNLTSESATEYGYAAFVVDPNTIVGQETITVLAGTFNCYKSVVRDDTAGTVTNLWYNSGVPISGLVKFETYDSNNQFVTERELTDYTQ
jgi:hypothetical protein